MMKSWKPFLARLTIFLVLVYGVVPLVIYFFGTSPQVKINMLLMPLAVIGTIGAFITLKRNELQRFPYAFSWRQAFIFSVLGYIFLILYIFQQNTWIGFKYNDIFVLLGGFYFLSASLFLFLAVFQLNFFKTFLKPILLAFLTIFAYVTVSLVALSRLGAALSVAVTEIVAWLMALTNDVHVNYSGVWPALRADSFSAHIAPACTGITSLALFTGLYLFVLFLDWKKMNKKRAALVYLIGLAGMFIVAILRTYSLFYIGTNWSPKFALSGFHTNAGWTFFVAYFLVYFWFAYPEMKKNNHGKL